jgi:tetratricopeptide (TPR) repeat protein
MLRLVQEFFIQKSYEKSQKLAQELIDRLEKQGNAPRLKDEIVRWQIRAMVRGGHADEGKRLLEKLLKRGPDDWRNLNLKAYVASELSKFDEAVRAYDESFRSLGRDNSLDPEEKTEEQRLNRYILSGLYVEMDQVDKAIGVLEKLLEQDPENATYNNDLGYIWADHDKKLDEAEKLVRKALDKDPKRPAYLDSMGWVLFKKKNYPEAKKYLLQAVQDKEGQHIEIYDHLGDTHLILGEKSDAVATWKKALAIKPESKREEQKHSAIEAKMKQASK